MAKNFGKPSTTEPGTDADIKAPAATTEAAPAETAPAEQPQPQPQPEPTPTAKRDLLTHLEARGAYAEAGPLYAAANPIGDLGFELGIHTGEGAEKQRAGIGIYLRVDHIAKRFPSKEIMDRLADF